MSLDYEDRAFKAFNFSTREFKNKEFYNCMFIDCNFSEVDLADVKFFNASFKNCNFSNALFSPTQIRDSMFERCKLMGVGFSRNNFAFSANFIECDLRYAEFKDLNLNKRILEQCNCENRNAMFHKCDLRESEFLEVKYLFINPLKNKIKKTKIDILSASHIVSSFGFEID